MRDGEVKNPISSYHLWLTNNREDIKIKIGKQLPYRLFQKRTSNIWKKMDWEEKKVSFPFNIKINK